MRSAFRGDVSFGNRVDNAASTLDLCISAKLF